MTWIEFFETAAKFAPLATAIVAVVAAIIAFLAILTQRDIARRRAAIDFFLKTEMDQTLIDLYNDFKKIAPTILSHPSMSDFAKTAGYQKVRAFLNVCELISVGINQGAFSKRVSYAYWGDVLPNSYKATLPLIKYVRESGDDGSAATYVDLEKICKKWTGEAPDQMSGRFQLLSIVAALLSAGLACWAALLPPLAMGSYWQPIAAAISALAAAILGFIVWWRG
ncbi:MAG TPA: DUF4760 domain-containing protein [Pseudolabrys sp.]|nr:DUF4760 domain-containing protein [Pseudolabrys sp.]